MQERDENKVADFTKKMGEILNFGALNLAMGIGVRLGIFEVLDRLERPETVAAIAREAGLSPRYLKEWLGIMACGGVVDLVEDNGEENFFLPGEHGDLLAKRAASGNLGIYAQEIPLLTRLAMEPVEKGFRTGQGVSYQNYQEFAEFMRGLSDAKHRSALVDNFLPMVNSGRLVKLLESGISVCDLGCGQGVASREMARAFPASDFTGLDLYPDDIDKARRAADQAGLTNVFFMTRDAAELSADPEMEGRFDWVSAFDAIHDQTRPAEALSGVFHILKPGGWFSMIDIAADSRISGNLNHAMGTFLYTVSLMHCLPVGLDKGGAGLGMMWGRQKAVAMLEEAGFKDIRVEEMPGDAFNLHFFCRK